MAQNANLSLLPPLLHNRMALPSLRSESLRGVRTTRPQLHRGWRPQWGERIHRTLPR